MYRIWTSGQNFLRKIVLQLEFFYNAIQLFFTWTSLANFYLAFFFVSAFSCQFGQFSPVRQLVSSATAQPKTDAFNFLNPSGDSNKNGTSIGSEVFEVVLKLYIALLFLIVVCSLGNRPQVSVNLLRVAVADVRTRVPSGHTFWQ